MNWIHPSYGEVFTSWKAKWQICICPKRSVPESIRWRWGNGDFQEWGNLWYWHCVGTAWSGGARITSNLCQLPGRIGKYQCFPGREGGCHLGHKVAVFETLPSCGRSKSWTKSVHSKTRIFFPIPLLFTPKHEVPVESLANEKNSSSWFLVSEVERTAWSSFHTLLSELHCSFLSYT